MDRKNLKNFDVISGVRNHELTVGKGTFTEAFKDEPEDLFIFFWQDFIDYYRGYIKNVECIDLFEYYDIYKSSVGDCNEPRGDLMLARICKRNNAQITSRDLRDNNMNWSASKSLGDFELLKRLRGHHGINRFDNASIMIEIWYCGRFEFENYHGNYLPYRQSIAAGIMSRTERSPIAPRRRGL